MQIKPVSNSNLYSQNFNGLWGKTSRATDYDEVLGIPKVVDTYYYYPFYNETRSDINKIIDNNTGAYIDDRDGKCKYLVKDCKVCTTLPFDDFDYAKYREIDEKKPITKLMRLVHSSVKDKFITKAYGNNQVSAANETVSKRILDKNI